MVRNKVEEEYLKTIYQLIQQKNHARVSDIAKKLSIRPSSVSEMIQKLHKKELVVYERYTPITLTPDGEALAKTVCQRHAVLKEFLQLLGIDKKIVEKDACTIEHCTSKETISQLINFMKFVRKTSNYTKWQEFRLNQLQELDKK